MTLTEYQNQEDPVRMPSVFLEEGEYTLGNMIAPKYGDTRQSIFVKGFPYEYCRVNNYCRLYTTDCDGNPKRTSCFIIRD